MECHADSGVIDDENERMEHMRNMKLLPFALLAALAAYGSDCTITDTLYDSAGRPYNGRVELVLNAPGAGVTLLYGAENVTGFRRSFWVENGVFGVSLYCSASISPAGATYRVSFTPTTGTPWSETWTPANTAGTVTLRRVPVSQLLGVENVVTGATALTTVGAVPYVTSAGVLGQNATNLAWDNANTSLTVTAVNRIPVSRGGGAIAGNLAIGVSSLSSNVTGVNNVSIGFESLQLNTASSNTSVGFQSLKANTSGASNSSFGVQALTSNTTGGANSAFGQGSLQANTTGGLNSAFGWLSLNANTSGASNTAIGRGALELSQTGSLNVAVGRSAGVTATSANANTTGSNNTWLGAESGPASVTQRTNSVAIGYQALVNADNAGVLGTAGMQWSVGGRTAPAATFHVENTTASTGVTTSIVRAGAGQNAALTVWQNATPTTLSAISDHDGRFAQGRDSVGVRPVSANAISVTHQGGNTTHSMAGFNHGNAGSRYFSLASDTDVRWTNSGTDVFSGFDTGLSRNAAGVVEVNNGTAGTYRDLTFRIAQWRNGTEAACDATTRGQVVMVQGGAGVADTFRVCRKDAADAYAWTALY